MTRVGSMSVSRTESAAVRKGSNGYEEKRLEEVRQEIRQSKAVGEDRSEGGVTLDVTSVLRRRDRLRQLFRQWWSCEFDGADIETIIPLLQAHLPGVERDPLFETLRQFTGRELLRSDFDGLAWLLAGNLSRLQSGLPAAVWSRQVADEWVPVQILRVFREKDNFENRAYRLTMVSLAGTPSGKVFSSLRRPPFLSMLSQKIGFTRKYGKLPYLDALQYVSMRFCVELNAAKSQHELVFVGVDSTSGTTSWNKEILKQRYRMVPCPRNFDHHCHHCVIGLDNCPAATHRLTYTQKVCTSCGDSLAWFDPELSPDRCVACAKKAAWF